jgi:CRP-like cAMP-binding protein
VLGEVAMLDGGPRTASAIVSEDARLLVVPGTAVRALLDQRAGLRERLLQTAQARLLA